MNDRIAFLMRLWTRLTETLRGSELLLGLRTERILLAPIPVRSRER